MGVRHTGRRRGIGPVGRSGRSQQDVLGPHRCFRGNHERWRRHSVFTQLRGVSIPQRAPLLNCSTTACATAARASAGAQEHPLGRGLRRVLDGCDRRVCGCPVELGCPVSAASAASTTATAGRPPATGRPATGGVTAPAGVVPPGVMTARRAAVSPAGPPAAAPTAAVAAVRAAPAPPAERLRPALARCLHDDRHEHDHDRHHDEAGHGATVLSFPRSSPPWVPRFLRERGMPGPLRGQSRVEELQRMRVRGSFEGINGAQPSPRLNKW